MTTSRLSYAIAKALQASIESPAERPMASDDQVAAEIVRLTGLGYIPSEQIVEPIRAYLSGYGVLLAGDTGVGKTMLMRLLGARIYPADKIVETYGLSHIRGWYEWTDGHAVCIDDVGSERTATDYGAKDEIIKAIVAHRADNQSERTHITTNLTAKQIAERYGDRTLSRIIGMCKAYTMTGSSKRSPKPASVN